MNAPLPFQPGASIVAYLRDSGGEDQELSVPQQRAFLTDWCQQNNLHLHKIFADIAAPGSSTISREKFLEMIAHFHDPACRDAGVIIWKFSRFSRDMDDSAYYRADLRRRGFIVYSIHDNIPDSSDGRIFEALIDWRNKKFLEDLSLDVKRGLHHMVSQYGAVPGTPPRGFKREPFIIGNHRDGSPRTVARWVPDPETWELCRQAWHMRANGVPVRQIHRQLQLFGSINSYVTFYSNRLYIGELVYGKTLIEHYCEPLVTKETWEKVQKMRDKNSADFSPLKGFDNRRHPKRANSNFLLSGLLYCAKCGALMNGDVVRLGNGKKLEYYQCGRAHRRMECDSRRIPKDTVETIIIDKLREFILDPVVMLEREKDLQTRTEDQKSQIQTEISALNQQLAKIRKKITNLANRISEDPDAPNSLVDLLRDLERKESVIHYEIDRLKGVTLTKEMITSPGEYLAELSAHVDEYLGSTEKTKKREFLHEAIREIRAERDGDYVKGIVYFSHPESEINMPTTMSHRRDETHRHKYSFPFSTKITHNYAHS
jgi:site-specific DNA recombinase